MCYKVLNRQNKCKACRFAQIDPSCFLTCVWAFKHVGCLQKFLEISCKLAEIFCSVIVHDMSVYRKEFVNMKCICPWSMLGIDKLCRFFWSCVLANILANEISSKVQQLKLLIYMEEKKALNFLFKLYMPFMLFFVTL